MSYAGSLYRLKSFIIDATGTNKLNAVNNTEFQIYPEMFEESDNSGVDWHDFSYFNYWVQDSAPSNCVVRFSGTGTGTQIFIKPSYVSFSFKANSNTLSGSYVSIPGYAYPNSIGGTSVGISLVKSVLGESANDLQGLCTSSHINPFSPNKPNGVSPYRLGDFRYYSHDVLGGVNILNGNIAPVDYLTNYYLSASATKNCETLGNVKLDIYIDWALYASVQKDLSASYFVSYKSAAIYNNNFTPVTRSIKVDCSKWNGSGWVLMSTNTVSKLLKGSPLYGALTSLTINTNTTRLNWNVSIHSDTGGDNLTFIVRNNTAGSGDKYFYVTTTAGTNTYTGIVLMNVANSVDDSFTLTCASAGFNYSGLLPFNAS